MTRASAGFVATKPFQVMTSMLLARTAVDGRSTLAVVPEFAGANAVVDRLRRAGAGFSSVRTYPDRVRAITALAAAGTSTIFLDSDVGLRTPLAMRLARVLRPGVRFAVYEEGVSLVRPYERDSPGPLSQRLGATMALGEDSSTEEVWAYASFDVLHERLPSKVIRRIAMSIARFIEIERHLLTTVFWPAFERDRLEWRGRRCSLYLSSWKVDERVLAALAAADGYSVCKLHPHRRGGAMVEVPRGIDQVPDPTIPAELLIMALAQAFDEVEVLHHDSSTEYYLQLPHVRFVGLAEPGTGDVGAGGRFTERAQPDARRAGHLPRAGRARY